MDAVLLRTLNGNAKGAMFLHDFSRFNMGQQFHWDTFDIALLPGGAGGGRDGILTASLDGLQLHTIANGSWDFAVTASCATGDWMGVQRIWTALHGSTYYTYGLNAEGTQILVGSWSLPQGEAAATFTPHESSSLSAMPSLKDLLFLNYDGDAVGQLEVAQVRDADVLISTTAGVGLAYFDFGWGYTPPAPASRSVAVSRGMSGANVPPAQRDLLCIYYWEPALQKFQLLGLNSGHVGDPLDLGTFKGHRLVSGDYNNDGFEELFLPNTEASTVKLLQRNNIGTLFTLDGNLESSVKFVQGPARPSAKVDFVHVFDLDQDSDRDIVGFQVANGVSHTILSAVAPSTALTSMAGGSYTETAISGGTRYEISGLALNLPTWPSGPPAPTHVRIQAWCQPNGVNSAVSIHPIVFNNNGGLATLDVPIGSGIPCTFGWDSSALTPGNWVLHMHARPIVKNGSNVSHVYPSRLAYYFASASGNLAFMPSVYEEASGLFGGQGGSGLGAGSGHQGNTTPPGTTQRP